MTGAARTNAGYTKNRLDSTRCMLKYLKDAAVMSGAAQQQNFIPPGFRKSQQQLI